jgi:uncharacterized protein with von Willebrand factor type A (vWA) domain
MRELALRLVRFGRALRAAGVGVTLRDELDGAEALAFVDGGDREEAHRALRVALKVARPAFATFDRLFAAFWADEEPLSAPPPRRIEAPRLPRGSVVRWDAERRRLGEGPGTSPEGDVPGYSPEALLRTRPFDEAACSPADVAAMERLLARLAQRLAMRRTRRLVPTAGRGFADLRRSFRRAMRTEGELLSLARRRRARNEPRFVFLCDTSGSMEPFSRFLLTFVLALRRAVRRAEVFAFNTELVRLTPWLAAGKTSLVLARLASAVPDWAGGTRIGASLAAFVERHAASALDRKTVVVILSDGLDRGEPEPLIEALREMKRRARRIVWLNPLLGDPRYEPTARGMQAALPFLDRLASAHNLESLERVLPHLAA